MYFDFEGRHEDHEPIGGSLRLWDVLLLSVVVHVVVILAVLFAPPLEIFPTRSVAAEALKPVTPPRDRTQFVFVQPRVDAKAPKPPQRAEDSDENRLARNVERRADPRSALPFARGNSPERIESSPEERAAGRGPAPEPSVTRPAPEAATRLPDSPALRPTPSTPEQPPRPPQGGSLGEALRNLQKYVDQESFNNPQGQVQNLGPLQFDTKGVEFGPWIRRFVSQVRRNWFVPMAAMTLRGHVVLTFFVHKNGALTDVQIIRPSAIESFNTAAMNALLASNPTEPLPPEYPADKAFFTVTFYYNENPGGQ